MMSLRLLAPLLLLGPLAAEATPSLSLDLVADEDAIVPVVDVDWDKDTRFWVLNGAVFGAATIYGVYAWDFGSHPFHFTSEDWFGSGTHFGGADKLGHAYTSYTTAAALCTLYDSWGYGRDEATWRGIGSSFALTSFIELCDGMTGEYGFSPEDMVFNTIGCGMQYARRRWPGIAAVVDYRWEYRPTPAVRRGETWDIITDYSGSKYLLAWKPEGLLRTGTWLRYLEVHTGYATRGYNDFDGDHFGAPQRRAYIAVGLNLAQIVREWSGGWSGAAVLDYYQVPGTDVGYPPF